MAEDTSILSLLSKDGKANLARIRKGASEDKEFAINTLGALLGELKALSPKERQSKYGIDNKALFEMEALRSNAARSVNPREVTGSGVNARYYPGRAGTVKQIRAERKAGYASELEPIQKLQGEINRRSLLENVGVAARAFGEGMIAPGMVKEYRARGLPLEKALSYVDVNDPLQQAAGSAGFAYGQGQIPSMASIPGNLGGGAAVGGIGRWLGGKLGAAAVGEGIGGLAGGIGGAVLTSWLGNKLLNPYSSLSEQDQMMLSDRFSSPARTIGTALSPVGLFSVMQGPAGARRFFEGAGLRQGVEDVLSRPNLGSSVVQPAVDLGSRIGQAFQSQAEISRQNSQIEQAFRDVHGRNGSIEELVSFHPGYQRSSDRLNQLASDAILGGFGALGNAVSGVSALEAYQGMAQRREARRALDAIQSPEIASGNRPERPTERVAPYGLVRTAVPRSADQDRSLNRPVSVVFDEGENKQPKDIRVQPSVSVVSDKQRLAITDALKKPAPVSTSEGAMDVVGIAPTGEIIVERDDRSKGRVLETRTYNELPAALKQRIDQQVNITTPAGERRPDWSATVDTAYTPTQDSYDGFAYAYPLRVKVDGTEVYARGLSLNDKDGTVNVELPSGTRLWVDRALVTDASGRANYDIRKTNIGLVPVTQLQDATGRDAFSSVKIRGVEYAAHIPEQSRGKNERTESLFLDENNSDRVSQDRIGTHVTIGSVGIKGKPNLTRVEQGVVVGVDTFKVDGQDASGYWVQSLTDASQKPYLVTADQLNALSSTARSTAPRTETPPPRTDTPPPRTETPPPRTETPPPRTETPPPPDETETPPPRTETPPPPDETETPPDDTKGEGEAERPEGAPEWPPEYTFKEAGETFGEVAEDKDLPAEMRSDRRGDAYYRYRRMTGGEQAERGAGPESIPQKFIANITRFVGRIRAQVKTTEVDFNLQDIKDKDSLISALKDVFGQTEEQSSALAEVVDRFATGWALEMMRLSGMRTQDVFRAVRTPAELKRAPKASDLPEINQWQAEFREQSVLRNDQETLETLRKLRNYFYAQRLGSIAALNQEQVNALGSPGFTKGFYGNNSVVNVAFALRGSENYVVQVHEVTHLLVRSMYAPMYHKLASAVLPALRMSNLGDRIHLGAQQIPSFVEERIVTSFLRALVTFEGDGQGGSILSEAFREGGANNDWSINSALGNLASTLRDAALTTTDSQQQILTFQGWSLPVTRVKGEIVGYYPTGTSFRLNADPSIEFVLTEPWDANKSPNIAIQGKFIDSSGKVLNEITINKKKIKSIKSSDIKDIGQNKATMGPRFKTQTVTDRQGRSSTVDTTTGVGALSAEAQSYLAQFFGHYSEFTQQLLDTVSVEPVTNTVFNPTSDADINRYTVGYRWWTQASEYREKMNWSVSDYSDTRLRLRTEKTYLGWLDFQNFGRSGFHAYMSPEQIFDMEILGGMREATTSQPNLGSVQPSDDTAPPDPSALIDDMLGGSWMSTAVDSEGEREYKKSPYRLMTENIIASFIKDKDVHDPNFKRDFVWRVLALPFVSRAANASFSKLGIDDRSWKPRFAQSAFAGQWKAKRKTTAEIESVAVNRFKDLLEFISKEKAKIAEEATDKVQAEAKKKKAEQEKLLREFKSDLLSDNTAHRARAFEKIRNDIEFTGLDDDKWLFENQDKRTLVKYLTKDVWRKALESKGYVFDTSLTDEQAWEQYKRRYTYASMRAGKPRIVGREANAVTQEQARDFLRLLEKGNSNSKEDMGRLIDYLLEFDMLPFEYNKNINVKDTAALNAPEKVTAYGATREFEYRVSADPDAQPFVFRYRIEESSDEELFRKNFIKQFRDEAARRETEESINESEDEYDLSSDRAIAKNAFDTGYYGLHQLPRIRESIDRFSEASRGVTQAYILGISRAVENELQFARTATIDVNGKQQRVIQYLESYLDDSKNLRLRWATLSEQQFADRILRAVYRGTDSAKETILGDYLGGGKKETDRKNTAAYNARSIAQSGFFGINEAEVAITYLSAFKASVLKARSKKKTDAGETDAVDLMVDVSEISAGEYWTGKDVSQGQEIINELIKKIKALADENKNDQSQFVSSVSVLLQDPKYRFIPAIAEYQFRTNAKNPQFRKGAPVSFDGKNVKIRNTTAKQAQAHIAASEKDIEKLDVVEFLKTQSLDEMVEKAGQAADYGDIEREYEEVEDRVIGIDGMDKLYADFAADVLDEVKSASTADSIKNRVLSSAWSRMTAVHSSRPDAANAFGNFLNRSYSEIGQILSGYSRIKDVPNAASVRMQAVNTQKLLDQFNSDKRFSESVIGRIVSDASSMADQLSAYMSSTSGNRQANFNAVKSLPYISIFNADPIYHRMNAAELALVKETFDQFINDPSNAAIKSILLDLAKESEFDLSLIDGDGKGFARFMDAMSAMSEAVAKATTVGMASLITDTPSAVELIPGLTVRELAIFRLNQVAKLFKTFNITRNDVSKMIGVSSDTAAEAIKTLNDKIAAHEAIEITKSMAGHRVTQHERMLINALLNVSGVDESISGIEKPTAEIKKAAKDLYRNLSPTQAVEQTLLLLLNYRSLTTNEKIVADNVIRLIQQAIPARSGRTLQAESLRVVSTVIRSASVYGSTYGVVGRDAMQRTVSIGQTSDNLSSTKEVIASIVKSMPEGVNSVLSMKPRKGETLYGLLLDIANGNAPEGKQRTYLTNEELRKIVMLGKEDTTPAERNKMLSDLIGQRDESVITPLKEWFKAKTKLELASVSIADLNAYLDSDITLSHDDKIAAMSVILDVASRENEREFVAWVILNERLPTFDEYASIFPDRSEASLKDDYSFYEKMQRNIGVNSIVEKSVGTQITLAQRQFADEAVRPAIQLIAFMPDIKPQDLPLTDAIAQSSMAYQVEVIRDFVNTELPLSRITATKFSDAVDTYRQNTPLAAATMPGKQRKGEKLSDKLSKLEPEDAMVAKLAGRVINIGIDAIRYTMDIAVTGTADSFEDLNPFFAGITRRQIEAVLASKSALGSIKPQKRNVIADRVDDLAKSLMRGILDARKAMLDSMEPSEMDGYSYVLTDPANNIVTAYGIDGSKLYNIDFANAQVVDANTGEIVTASKLIDVTVPGKGTFKMTPAQAAMYRLMTSGMDLKLVASEEVRKSANDIALAVLANEALRSVPSVYWHAQLRVESPLTSTVEPMFMSTAIDNPETVYNSVGAVDETTRQLYVMPVVTSWMRMAENGLRRVVTNSNGDVFFDGEGYTVYREDGKHSNVFSNLIAHGLSWDKALEIYALTEHPKFREWAQGDLIESMRQFHIGSMVDRRVRNNKARTPLYNAIQAQHLVNALDRALEDSSDKAFDDFAFWYTEVFGFKKKGDSLVLMNDSELYDKLSKMKDSPDRMLHMSAIRNDAANIIATAANEFTNPIIDSHRAFLEGQQDVSTGKPFHALSFAHVSDSFIGNLGDKAMVVDFGSGLHENSNRRNTPYWVKFTNPLVHNLGGFNVEEGIVKSLIEKAVSKGHDGVVLTNVVDTLNDTTRKNIGIVLQNANVLPVSQMTNPISKPTTVLASDVEPMFLSTAMIAPVTSYDIPALLAGDPEVRERTITEKALRFGQLIFDNAMSFARNPLSSDFAFSFIQGGKAALGIFTGRPGDTMAWIMATFGSFRGMAPNLQITINGRKFGYDKLGRRQWIKQYLALRNDEDWEVMKALRVPMHFMNFEKKLESERVRLYLESNGAVDFENIQIDMLDYDERGNLDDVFEHNTLISMMPLAGMFERQMSLQHDLLMFHQIKWQLKYNPEFAAIRNQSRRAGSNFIDDLKRNKSAQIMVNFIANTMGDFQYTTNDRYDIWTSRIGKSVMMAPRWYASNIITAFPFSAMYDAAYERFPKFREFAGEANRSYGLYKHDNAALRKYQLQSTMGTAALWFAVMIGHMLYGRIARDPKMDWSKGMMKVGSFRRGDWEISESTGRWDLWNRFLGTVTELGLGGIGTKPRLGETEQEAENAGFLRAANRIGYVASPLYSFIRKLVTGTDSLGRNAFATNEEFLMAYDYAYKELGGPYLKEIGIDLSKPLASSVILTEQVPTAIQDAWSAFAAARRKTLDAATPEEALVIAIQQFTGSATGARIRYNPYVPEELKKVFSQQWVVKRFVEKAGRSPAEIIKQDGWSAWMNAFRYGE